MNRQIGNPGDQHYKCLHGRQKVMTITKKMKSSLNGASFIIIFELIATKLAMILIGLVSNLRLASAPMYDLYLTMKDRSPDQITKEEILLASGQKVIDPGAVSKFISQMESTNGSIQHAFEKQLQDKAVCECL